MPPQDRQVRSLPCDPAYIHHTPPHPLRPSAVEASLTTFLTRSASRPYLHPDSHLANTGIRFAIGSGPNGGIAFHHLRRIAAGLRGEFLEKQTPEQLAALFGERYTAFTSDDHALDAAIARSERKKRKREDIEDWAETSSVSGETRTWGDGYEEIESFANTPLLRPDDRNEWQDPDYDALQREPWAGGVGGMAARDGEVPELVRDDGGDGGRGGKKSREERRAAKRERKAEEKRAKIAAAEGNRVREAGRAEKEEEGRESERRAKRRKRDEASDSEGWEMSRDDPREARKEARKRKRDESSDEDEAPDSRREAKSAGHEEKQQNTAETESSDEAAKSRTREERRKRKRDKKRQKAMEKR